MNKRFEWINKTLEKAESLSNILTNKRFEDISNKELYEIYTQYVNTFTNIFQGYNLSQPEVPAVCEEELLKSIDYFFSGKSSGAGEGAGFVNCHLLFISCYLGFVSTVFECLHCFRNWPSKKNYGIASNINPLERRSI